MLSKIIYLIGSKLRSPELKEKYKFLKETECWTIEDLENYQLNQLKKLIKVAYDKSTFYQQVFQEAGFSPNDLKTLNDLKKIPIITKKDILENNLDIQNREGFRKLLLSETSGSTGEPLVFYRNSEWDAGHRAAQLRGYSWFGINPWDRNGYFWGYSFSLVKKLKTKVLDILLNRFRLFSYHEDNIINFAEKLKNVKYLEGYSSMIYEVAKVVNKYSLGPFNLKMIKGTSEKIYDSYQEEVTKAFGQKIISEYGAAETGIIAYECPSGHMHIAMENVIVEEENGEAVITNLLSDSFPIIRYKLGDSIVIDKKTVCSCGMKHYIVKDILGRVGKTIHGVSNKYPSLTLYYIFKNFTLNHNITLNYQAIQKERGKLEIHIDTTMNQKSIENLIKECKSYFNDDIEVKIFPNSLKREFDKKFKDFITEID